MIDHDAALHLLVIVSHLAVMWGGIALFILVSVLWVRKHREPTAWQALLFAVIMLCAVFVLLTVFDVLPVTVYGQLDSVGLAASLQQTAQILVPGVGWLVAILLIMVGGKWAFTRLRPRH